MVLNHESTLWQAIQAIAVEQNVQWSAVWNSDKKEFIGIITIRNLLEILVFFVEWLKDSFLRTEVASMAETPFISYFLERYMNIPPSQVTSEL